MTTPRIWVSPTAWRCRASPKLPNAAPNETNTTAVPATNPSVPITTRRMVCTSVEDPPSLSSATDTPVT